MIWHSVKGENIMQKIITIANRKGGVGKSTTAYMIASYLGTLKKSYKTLLIDTDPQGSLTSIVTTDVVSLTLSTIIQGGNISDSIIKTTQGFDFIASSPYLSLLEKNMSLQAIKEITDKLGYDFIIIDTPPTFSNLTIASLVASTDVVIPLEADSFSLQGFEALYKLINGVRERYNNTLNIAGLLLIKYKARQTLSKLIKASLEKRAAECGTTLFASTIRDSVLIKKALLLRLNIFKEYPNQPITKDYENFCFELLGVYEK